MASCGLEGVHPRLPLSVHRPGRAARTGLLGLRKESLQETRPGVFKEPVWGLTLYPQESTRANSWMLFRPRLPPPPHLLLETLCPCLPRSLSSFGLHHPCSPALLPPLWPCGLGHLVEASFSSPPHTSMPFRVPPQVLLSSLPSNPRLCFCLCPKVPPRLCS